MRREVVGELDREVEIRRRARVPRDLRAERTAYVDDGHHYSVYETRLDRITVELADGELRADVHARSGDDVADRFTDLWEGL